MHPLIAASLSTQLVAPARRLAAPASAPGHHPGHARSRRPPSSSSAAPGPPTAPPSSAWARSTATAPPGELLARAAEQHEVLVAEVDGSIEAALALDGGLAVADPFRPSAPDAKLLALRARQLGGDADGARRGRLGVLHPRTS